MGGLKQKLHDGAATLRRLIAGLRTRAKTWRPRHTKSASKA